MSGEDSQTKTPDDYVSDGREYDWDQIFKGAVGGWILAVSASFIAGAQQAIEFLYLPFEAFTDVVLGNEAYVGVIEALFLKPLKVVPDGVDATSDNLDQFDFLGLPASVLVVLITFLIIGGFLSLAFTSNVLPGIFVDNPVFDFLFGTPEEEVDEEG